MNLLLQKELNSLFNSLKFPFYDGIQDKGFPYGSFGYFTQDRNNTKTTKGNEIFMQLDLFSDYNGQKEIKEMIEWHGRLQLKYKGEYTAIREMRKHISWYTGGLPHSAALRAAVNQFFCGKILLQ